MANPSDPSSDYCYMQPFWEMVDAILHGAPSMRAPAMGHKTINGPQVPVANIQQLNPQRTSPPFNQYNSGYLFQSPYLPKFPNETPLDYQARLCHAPFTNIYADISRNLSSKPFSKKLELDEKTDQSLKDLALDIDGRGHDLHVFGSDIFKAAVDYGIAWILVDYTKTAGAVTRADDRALGARPYWVHIASKQLLAVYSDFVAGKEIITHARIDECYTKREGYGEERVKHIRQLNRDPIVDVKGNVTGYGPATWELYEEVEDNKNDAEWVLIDSGLITVGYIPLVPIVFGHRDGASWRINAPLKDIAYMQVEEFQQESGLKYLREMNGFSMLALLGVTPPTNEDGTAGIVPVGPKVVITLPPNADGGAPDAKYIGPDGSASTFLESSLEKLQTQMRDLGMQPLATANLTVITTANVAMKAHSAVQAWALLFKDGLETAWQYTCDWLNRSDKPEVAVYTDFGVDLTAQTELDSLLKAQAQGILSKQTIQKEFKRRGVLADDFDPDEEEQILAEEDQGLTPEVAIDPATGELVHPTTRPKVLTPAPAAPAAPPPAQAGPTIHIHN